MKFRDCYLTRVTFYFQMASSARLHKHSTYRRRFTLCRCGPRHGGYLTRMGSVGEAEPERDWIGSICISSALQSFFCFSSSFPQNTKFEPILSLHLGRNTNDTSFPSCTLPSLLYPHRSWPPNAIFTHNQTKPIARARRRARYSTMSSCTV